MKTRTYRSSIRTVEARVAVNLKDRQFGGLTVINRHPENSKNGRPRWICRCTCGKEVIVRSDSLTRGKAETCGCSRRLPPCHPAIEQAIQDAIRALLPQKHQPPTSAENLALPQAQPPTRMESPTSAESLSPTSSQPPTSFEGPTCMDERLASPGAPQKGQDDHDGQDGLNIDPDELERWLRQLPPEELAAIHAVERDIERAIAQIVAEDAKTPPETGPAPATENDPWATEMLSLLEAQKNPDPAQQMEYLRWSRLEWERRKRAEFYERALDIDAPRGSSLSYEYNA